jgi:hypothetical protein
MAQYIDKGALVAEIERRIKEISKEFQESNTIQFSLLGKVNALENLLPFINTLEVKDVDLEKEAELIANGIMIGVQANKYNTVVYNTKRNDFNHSHLMLAARKGIELGLKAAQPDNQRLSSERSFEHIVIPVGKDNATQRKSQANKPAHRR